MSKQARRLVPAIVTGMSGASYLLWRRNRALIHARIADSRVAQDAAASLRQARALLSEPPMDPWFEDDYDAYVRGSTSSAMTSGVDAPSFFELPSLDDSPNACY